MGPWDDLRHAWQRAPPRCSRPRAVLSDTRATVQRNQRSSFATASDNDSGSLRLAGSTANGRSLYNLVPRRYVKAAGMDDLLELAIRRRVDALLQRANVWSPQDDARAKILAYDSPTSRGRHCGTRATSIARNQLEAGQ